MFPTPYLHRMKRVERMDLPQAANNDPGDTVKIKSV
jgi:hypothetical protein